MASKTLVFPGLCGEEEVEERSLASYRDCRKKEKHDKFICIGDFKESHLPEHVNKTVMFDAI